MDLKEFIAGYGWSQDDVGGMDCAYGGRYEGIGSRDEG